MPLNLTFDKNEINAASAIEGDSGHIIPPNRLAPTQHASNTEAIRSSRMFEALLYAASLHIATHDDDEIKTDPMGVIEMIIGGSLEAGIVVGYAMRVLDEQKSK